MLNLDKNKKYLLACSNGPDSMALFNMLLEEGYIFEVAHVNYHLRNESDFEEENLRKICTEKNIKLHVLNNEEKISKNIEERCRIIRYNFFSKVVSENKLDSLLVAHHKDDLIETYLLQEKRKIYPKYWGIKSKSYNFNICIERPLLSFYKDEILEYCVKKGVSFSLDKTNEMNLYERNIIRNKYLKDMSKVEKDKIIEKIYFKNKELSSILERLNNSDLTNIDTLLSFDDMTFCYAIDALIKDKIPSFGASKGFCYEVKKLLNSNKPNIAVKLDEKYDLVKEKNRLLIFPSKVEKYEYKLETPTKLDTPYFYLDFSDSSKDHHKIQKSDYPLTITNCYEGKTYKIKEYDVQIRRLYIDWKMPRTFRSFWPIIINKKGEVVFVPRYQENFSKSDLIDFYVKLPYAL